MKRNILILGASYGSLLGTKLLMAGHGVTLVCTRQTAELVNREGTRVRFPVKGKDALVEVVSTALPGSVDAVVPDQAQPGAYDLIVLAMQESQYGAPGVRELMARVAASGKPCLAIMNMPPLAYLRRIPALASADLGDCYAEPEAWDGFEPGLVSLASPDPQAFRPQDQPKNVLQVGLPTNFKAAPFAAPAHTALLRGLADDIERASGEIPVKLKVHDSLFVPMAKWPMLIAGNYRCVRPGEMIPIREAVHGSLARSRAVYDWVARLCMRLGAGADDLVPFDKYAKAAEGLLKPSSAARALFGGAPHIERVDRLVQCIASRFATGSETLDEIVELIDARLAGNRAAPARAAA